jgi:hypothetical protein
MGNQIRIDMKVGTMNTNAIVLALGATALLSGCIGDGSANDVSESTATENLVVAQNAFVALHVTPAGAPLRCVRHFTDGDHRNQRIAITENDRWRSRERRGR